MKNRLFLDNTFVDESDDICDNVFGTGNETSVVEITIDMIVENSIETLAKLPIVYVIF